MEGSPRTGTEVGLVPAAGSDDEGLAARLTALVNEVYAVAESGLWRAGVTRTSNSEITGLMRDGELAVARHGDVLAGCVRVRTLHDDRGELGMLAVSPARRGSGVGRALLRFAEEISAARGLRLMQLELLVPQDWTHPSKTFLENWYTRTGYRLVRTERPEEGIPHLAELLVTPCDYRIYQKTLSAA